MSAACGTCGYWQGTVRVSAGDPPIIGECRRRAPLAPGPEQALWPSTQSEEWCGEYEAESDQPRCAIETCNSLAKGGGSLCVWHAQAAMRRVLGAGVDR